MKKKNWKYHGPIGFVYQFVSGVSQAVMFAVRVVHFKLFKGDK